MLRLASLPIYIQRGEMGKVIPFRGRRHPSRQKSQSVNVAEVEAAATTEVITIDLPQNDLIGPLRDAGLIIDRHGYSTYAIDGLSEEQRRALAGCTEDVATMCLQLWKSGDNETS